MAAAFNAGNLQDDPNRETALDRLGAIASADPLGESLWRLKYARERAQVPVAAGRLSNRLRQDVRSPGIRLRLAAVVLSEWLDEACETCQGRRFIIATDDTPASVCTVCNGTGIARHSEQRRMRKMDFSLETCRRWEGRFAAGHEQISRADARVWRAVALKLGRIAPPESAQKAVAFSARRFTLITGRGLPAVWARPLATATGA